MLEEEAIKESYKDFEIPVEVWPLISRSNKWSAISCCNEDWVKKKSVQQKGDRIVGLEI